MVLGIAKLTPMVRLGNRTYRVWEKYHNIYLISNITVNKINVIHVKNDKLFNTERKSGKQYGQND